MTFSPELEARFDKLLKSYPPGRERSAMIPMLMYAQDEIGSVTDELIEEVARRVGVTPLHVNEVLTYYSMLHRKPLGKYHVQVCTNISCLLHDGENSRARLQETRHRPQGSDRGRADFARRSGVHRRLLLGPGHPGELRFPPLRHARATGPDLEGMKEIHEILTMLYNEPSPLETRVLTRRFGLPNSASLETYLATDGYKGFLKAAGMKPEEVIDEVKASNLRGRGGAGFPTGMKWSFVPRTSPKPKYIVVNADESEPGTCKDRVLMENDPHQLIEGMLIAGKAVDAHAGYIYIRGEYRYLIEIMDKAIAEAYAAGWLGKKFRARVWISICTRIRARALTNAARNRRCSNRSKASAAFRASGRRFRRWWGVSVPHRAEQRGDVLRGAGHPARWRPGIRGAGGSQSGRHKMTCLTGHVNKPGVYELRLGFPVKQMIEEVGGGMRNGKKLKAFIPGGSSCPVLTAEEATAPTWITIPWAAKSMLGSGGVIIMDEDTCMVKAALRIMRFYAHESCGWCIPCREGTTWIRKILTRFHDGGGTRSDINLIGDLAKNMLGRTFCPLGDAAAMPTISIVEKFRGEFEDHLNGRPCPYEHGAWWELETVLLTRGAETRRSMGISSASLRQGFESKGSEWLTW